MPTSLKVPRGCGFVVTELGRSAAASVETCECTVWVMDKAMLGCPKCQTAERDLSETRYIGYGKPKRD
jgi:hypothetical protein